LAKHYDEALSKLKSLFGIRHFYTDGWGGYERHIPAKNLTIGKNNIQKIEINYLTIRIIIKRLTRKTICF
jgi:insertion element IS1 protein InsB